MMLNRLFRTSNDRRGATMVEAAFALGIFLMLTIGILEVGRAWFSYNLLVHAVREGARLASVTPNLSGDDPDVLARVRSVLALGGLAPTADSVDVDNFPVLRGDPVTVSAQVNFSPASALIPIAVPLRVQVTTRYE